MRLLLFYCILFSVNMCGQSKKIVNTPPPTVEQNATTVSEAEKKAELTFPIDHMDFGMVKKGDTRDTVFQFTNTGTEDIIIDLVTACECTTLTYPEEPITIGASGEIGVSFDSSDKDVAETITIDIILRNTNPRNGYPIVYQLTYDFDIAKP